MRYVVHPDWVTARDGDRHFIGVAALERLYGLLPSDRVVVHDERVYRERADDVHLYPRFGGDYWNVHEPNAGVLGAVEALWNEERARPDGRSAAIALASLQRRRCDYCAEGLPKDAEGWHLRVDPEGIEGTARIPCMAGEA